MPIGRSGHYQSVGEERFVQKGKVRVAPGRGSQDWRRRQTIPVVHKDLFRSSLGHETICKYSPIIQGYVFREFVDSSYKEKEKFNHRWTELKKKLYLLGDAKSI